MKKVLLSFAVLIMSTLSMAGDVRTIKHSDCKFYAIDSNLSMNFLVEKGYKIIPVSSLQNLQEGALFGVALIETQLKGQVVYDGVRTKKRKTNFCEITIQVSEVLSGEVGNQHDIYRKRVSREHKRNDINTVCGEVLENMESEIPNCVTE